MKLRLILLCGLAAGSLMTGCSDTSTINPQQDEASTAVYNQALTKAQDPNANGDKDFCNDVNATCDQGEGDCDSDSQCTGTLVCGNNNGPKFGMPGKWDVCVPAHCVDGVFSGDETGTDCGGSCGMCPPSGNNGDANFCSNGPLCNTGEGDCDNDAECAGALVCGNNNGKKFGLPTRWDVCVPAHCVDGSQSGDETGVDCGGSCGMCTDPMPPATECLIISEYVEGSGTNKAIEIFNCGSGNLDLSQFGLCLLSNSNTTCNSTTGLSGDLAAGQTQVLCSTSATIDPALDAKCDVKSSTINFNGDDRIYIFKGTESNIVDAFGEPPVRPSTSIWANQTFQRTDCTPYLGVGAFDVATYYTGLPSNTFDGLGSAACP